jgi:cysteine sulfinate desulfinase/cysteine desulfurase-like protein
VPEQVGCGAVRFSLGQWTAASDIDQLLELLQLRVLKPHAK